ncbi:hypothetical protein ACFWMR_01915 [Amycolatopsis thailandensis]|uniref:hypothetical protein n=1 Tax=Amycolatopsis thailandensis TaxID=589330 RepID=UPI00364D2901
MTSPPPPPERVAAHDAAALAAEAAAVATVVAAVEAAFASVWQWVLASWARVFGSPDTVGEGEPLRELLDDLAGRIAAVDVDRVDELLDGARQARKLGIEQGATEAGIDSDGAPLDIDPATPEAIDRGVEQAKEKLQRAADELKHVEKANRQAVLDRASIGRQAVPVLTRTARTTFNAELNGGILTAAIAAGAQVLWIAERDACLACTALSGHLVIPGQAFPDGTQFGRQRGAFAPVTAPPLHPHCRCRISPWSGHDSTAAARSAALNWSGAMADARQRGDQAAIVGARRGATAAAKSGATGYPEALRREAERAVLRGDSAFDTEHARLGAADRLLMRIGTAKNSHSPSGWQVPAAVKAKTRGAVRRGSFSK